MIPGPRSRGRHKLFSSVTALTLFTILRINYLMESRSPIGHPKRSRLRPGKFRPGEQSAQSVICVPGYTPPDVVESAGILTRYGGKTLKVRRFLGLGFVNLSKLILMNRVKCP